MPFDSIYIIIPFHPVADPPLPGISVKTTIIYEWSSSDLTIRVLILPESQDLV